MIVSCGMAIASTAALGIVLVLCCQFSGWLLRTRAPIALPLAFCALVALETVIMNVLTMFCWVVPGAVLASHAILAAGGVWYLRHSRRAALFDLGRLRRRLGYALRSPVAPYLVPLVAVLYAVALIYPPNNYDSLTYHMARVVFWVQNQSVDFYSTINPRQNSLGPGAEYLILLLQELTGTDRLANSVQTTAFLIIVVSVVTITRYLRAPRPLRIPLVLIFCTTPGFLLEATSTQNDLCAAVAALAILTVLRRLLFAQNPLPVSRDGIALAIAMAACYLIKPNALIFTAPLFACAGWRAARAAIRERTRKRWGPAFRAGMVALVLGAALCAPHALRTVAHPHELGPVSNLVFPLSISELTVHRLLNPLVVVPHHVPLGALATRLGRLYDRVGKNKSVSNEPWWVDGYYSGHALRQYEDLAGSPVQFIAVFLLSGVGVVWAARRRQGAWSGCGSRGRALLLALLLPASWALFHWIARNNFWIARYHTPWLALGVLSAFGACQLARRGRRSLAVAQAVAWSLATPSVVYAWSTVVANELRPVSTQALAHFDRIKAYYAHAPELRAEHDHVLEVLKKSSCRELVLALGNDDSIEYPLTWRALRLGVKVYHRPGPATACLLYAPNGLTSAVWKPAAPNETKLYVPSLAEEKSP